MTTVLEQFDTLLGLYEQLLTAYNISSEIEKRNNQNKMLDITDLIEILKNVRTRYGIINDDLKLDFADMIQILLSVINSLLNKVRTLCTDEKYVLSIGGTRLDSIVYNPDTDTYPSAVNCLVKDVLVPQLNTDGSYKVVSSYDAIKKVLNSSIDMELVNADIFNKELNRTDDKKPNIPLMIENIIKRIIGGQTNITEFTITGEDNRHILSSNPIQPPSTYAYGEYKNFKTTITDRYLKLHLKIHNPTQGFKITHLINVPQTYTNSYAHKESNYEKF
jgi:hypothetical protein